MRRRHNHLRTYVKEKKETRIPTGSTAQKLEPKVYVCNASQLNSFEQTQSDNTRILYHDTCTCTYIRKEERGKEERTIKLGAVQSVVRLDRDFDYY